jgi:hypothetical protein
MRRKSENHPDMSLTNLTTALCGQPLFRDLPIGKVYQLAEQAQAAAVAALKAEAAE